MFSKNLRTPVKTWLACALTLLTATNALANNNNNPGANQNTNNSGINSPMPQWAEPDRLLLIYRTDKIGHGQIKDKVNELGCKVKGWVMSEQHIEGINVTEPVGNGVVNKYWEFPMLIETPANKLKEMQEALTNVPGVISCAPNYYLYACGQANNVSSQATEGFLNQFQKGDPYYQNQWHLPAMRVPALQHKHWDMRIGLIDAGVKTYLPELKKDHFVNKQGGYDATTGSTFGDDTIGHGTMVATTMVAVANNGIGTAGVSRNRNVMAMKAINDKGLCTDYLLYKSLAKFGGKSQGYHNNIVTISFNAPGSLSLNNEKNHPAFHHLSKILFEQRNCLIFLPSGNFGGVDNYPNRDYLMVVTSFDQQGKIANKTTKGAAVDFCAPGVNIVCTDQNGAVTAGNGTCFAAANAAAAAAVVEDAADYYKWGAYPGTDTLKGKCDAKWLIDILKESAYVDGIEGGAMERGRGCIDVKKAIAMIKKQHEDTIKQYQELGWWK